jgi:hypothetical protein
MKRKAEQTTASQPQLPLPFVQQAAIRDLSYYIGLCKVFAAYHKRWPTASSTRGEFKAARIPGYDGDKINRQLRLPDVDLEADPAFQALRNRCFAEGAEAVDVGALDPRYRLILVEQDIVSLFDTISLIGRAGPDDVRYATGVPAHGLAELTLRPGEEIRARALEQVGFDPGDPRTVAYGYSVRVKANDELKAIMERIGVHHPATHERLADMYLLEASDEGHLDIKFQLLAGRRYAGMFDVDLLVRKLASVYAASTDLASMPCGAQRELPPSLSALAMPAPDGDAELHEQLVMLEPEDGALKLPIQKLSRFADIRRLLEREGGIYCVRTQRFEFEEGTDPSLVVARLLSDGAF